MHRFLLVQFTRQAADMDASLVERLRGGEVSWWMRWFWGQFADTGTDAGFSEVKQPQRGSRFWFQDPLPAPGRQNCCQILKHAPTPPGQGALFLLTPRVWASSVLNQPNGAPADGF